MINIRKTSLYILINARHRGPFYFILWGWLKSKVLTGTHGNSKINPPKARIILGWETFLALDLWCTLPPMFHPIIVDKSRWTGSFQSTTWEPQGLLLGEIGVIPLVQGAQPWKEEVGVMAPLILMMPISELHINIDQLTNETTPYFMLVATPESSVFLSFFLCGAYQRLELTLPLGSNNSYGSKNSILSMALPNTRQVPQPYRRDFLAPKWWRLVNVFYSVTHTLVGWRGGAAHIQKCRFWNGVW